MIPVSLHLTNFLSYGESAEELDFTQFRLACLSGPNGHGKSALLDAITWGLWGQGRKATGGGGKPEGGLLRLGERRMQVEFAFELSGRRYRVIRSFELRKSGTEKRDLQFQVWDGEAEQYRSLTQKRQTDTQKAIIETLRMDYETFINSSFLLQGRTDEFTRKKPGERKEILAEILGLSRYDRLQQLAREHARVLDRSLLQGAARREAIEQEIERRPGIQRQFKKEAEKLQAISKQWEAQDQEARRLAESKEALQKQKVQYEGSLQRLQLQEKAWQQAEQRRAALSQQLEGLREVLRDRAGVEERHRRALQLQERLKALTGALQKHAAWERQRSERLRQLDQAAARLEQKRVQLESRRDAAEGRIEEAESLLARREEIEKQAGACEQLREEVVAMERRREQRGELEKALVEARRSIDEARSKVEIEKARVKTQVDTLQKRAKQEEALREALSKAQKRQEQFEAIAEQVEGALEKGQQLKSRGEVLENALKQLRAGIEQEREKITLLEQSEEPNCPLCSSALTEDHRGRLLGRLRDELERSEKDQTDKAGQLEDAGRQLEQQREEFRRLQAALAGREKVQEEVGRLEGELKGIESSKQECEALSKKLDALEDRLAKREYAEDAGKKERDLEQQMARVDFSPERLAELRKRQDALSPFLAERQRLGEVERNLKAFQQQRAGLLKRLSRVEGCLSAGSYGLAVRRSIGQTEAAMKALAYDPAEHERVERERAGLARAEAEWARLEESLKQLPGLEQQHGEAVEAVNTGRAECAQLREEMDALKPELEELPRLAEALERAERDRAKLGAEREQCNLALGLLKQEEERLEGLALERKEIERQYASGAEEKGRFDLLADAFGPKGVQALIIENAVPEIQNEANRILARLTDNRTQVAFETVREKKTGGAVETLDIKISDEMGTRDYEMYSGGEAFRTDLAIRIAVSRLLARRAGTRLQTLVIDEGFGTQDEEGLEGIVQVIRDIADEFEKILVVTHLESLKDAFPTRIEVTKHPERGSTFEVIHN